MALQDEVIAIVSKVIKIPEGKISSSSGLGNLVRWDSLNHATLVLELEDAFDICFDFDELDRIVTVRAIVQSLEAKGVNR